MSGSCGLVNKAERKRYVLLSLATVIVFSGELFGGEKYWELQEHTKRQLSVRLQIAIELKIKNKNRQK